MDKKFLIIDGNSLINRAFYGLPLLTNSKGQFTGAIFGFIKILIKLLEEQKPTHVLVAFDHARKTFRNNLYPEYKAKRSATPSELVVQIQMLKDLLDKMGIKRYEQEGIEGDDIIGTVCALSPYQNCILSGDKDVFQLINDKTKVIFTVKGISETQVLGEDNLKDIFGYSPKMVVELKALMGDNSDNIPGVSGIGLKTAISLLEKHKSLDAIFENVNQEKGALHEKLVNGKELAFISKTLATIKRDCQLVDFCIDDCEYKMPFSHEVFSLFEDYEFKSLIKRPELFEQTKLLKTIKEERINIVSLNEIDNIILQAKQSKQFAFYMLSSFEISAIENKLYNLDNTFSMFSTPIEIEKVLDKLKIVLEDESIEKITYDLKKHLHLFYNHNIKLKGDIFDVSISEYLVNAGNKYETNYLGVNEYFSRKQNLLTQMAELELTKLYYEMEMPLTFVLFEMENQGFKIDQNALNELAEKYELQIKELTNKIYEVAETTFNINSPKQLAEILFNKLKLKSYYNKKLSTNIEVLNDLSNQHPIISLVIKYRKIFKLYSTYIDSYKKIVAMSGDVIHTIFNQTLTSTGRLSSSEPNLQNIPIRDDEGRNLRKIFVSNFDGGSLVSADYNQIELRLLASFSGDENMINTYKNGKDIHSITASQIFDVPIELVSRDLRRDAKAVNFGIIYGMSDYGLATALSISRKQAKEYIEKYFANYPKVKVYMENNIAKAKENGLIRTLFNRLRRINEINSSNFQLRQFGERVAMNMPLQGSASDIIKKAMICVYNALKNNNLKSKVILQIHDELIIDCAPDEVEIVKQLLRSNMENVVSLPVSLPVEVSEGKTWFDCK